MPRETRDQKKLRTAEILKRLRQLYPDANCALHHDDAWQLLVATILSAQCTDARVNLVTPALFKKYPTPQAMADAALPDLEKMVASTGFFRNKAKAIKNAATDIVRQHGGAVPQTMEQLTKLHGVGRKTANVVLGNAFDKNIGVVVDTHVGRLTRRLKLSSQGDPEKVERDLMTLVPETCWTLWSHLLIFHGRKICLARKPRCNQCVVADICPAAHKV